MNERENARFRATAGEQQDFGSTPQEALNALMARLAGDAPTPIVIWPYNRGDAYYSETQQARLQDLKSRRATLTDAERQEWEALIEASFDATIGRTQSMPVVKT
jgi:hypothetical protein